MVPAFFFSKSHESTMSGSTNRNTRINSLIVFADIIISCLIFVVLHKLTFGFWELTKDDVIILLSSIILWSYLLKRFDLSKIYKTNPHSYILRNYVSAMLLGLLGLVFITFILKIQPRRFFLIEFVTIDFAAFYLFIVMIYHIAQHQRARGLHTSNIFIIGDKNIGSIIHKIETNTYWGYRIKGIITEDSEVAEKYNRYPIYSIDNIKEKLLEEPIDEVFYCLSTLDNKMISNLVYLCLELGITFRVSSQILSLTSTKAQIYYVGEMPFFTFQNTPRQNLNMLCKNIFDKVASGFAIIVLSPVFILTAIAIKIDSKGPVFFTQKRSGLRGREFTLYKFRSMCDHAEEMKDTLLAENEQDGPVFKIKDDKRITRVGRFIRKFSIDETPQFFNVLKGDMSIVGPRPPLPSEVKEYKPWQTRKLSMKPGLTCIWQVSGRNQIPFEQWMKLDLQYIDTWSLGLDFMILLKTIKVVLKHDGQ